MSIDTQLKFKADKLFWIFENLFFQNTGNYPRKTNLVLEFADFIAHAQRPDLECFVSFSSEKEFQQLKQMINQGIDCWLDAGDIKTLLIS